MGRRWATWAILVVGLAVLLGTAGNGNHAHSAAAPTQTLVAGLTGPVTWAASYCIEAGNGPAMQPVQDAHGNAGFRPCPS